MEQVGIQEFEYLHTHLLEGSASDVGHLAEPRLAPQFLAGHGLRHVQQFLRDQPFELAKGFLEENLKDFVAHLRVAFAQDELAALPEQRLRRVTGFLF